MTDLDAHKQASDQFHKVMGYCIAQWAHIERELFKACWMTLGCPRQQAAIVYYRVPNVGTRLSLVSELVHAVLPKPARESGGQHHPSVKKWRAIDKAIRDELSVRSWTAHRPATVRYETFTVDNFEGYEIGEYDAQGNYVEDYTDLVQVPVFELWMSGDEQLRGISTEKLTVAEHELLDHYERLGEIAGDLNRFAHKELLPRCGEPRETWPHGHPAHVPVPSTDQEPELPLEPSPE